MLHYTPPKQKLPSDFDEFYASLTPKEQELHILALNKLGSSYLTDIFSSTLIGDAAMVICFLSSLLS